MSAMRCPEPVHSILCEILRVGSLRARSAAWSGDAARAAIEADHIHNLPSLLRDYSDGALECYWNGERSAFLTQLAPEDTLAFEQPWGDLARRLPKPCSQPEEIDRKMADRKIST